jgi:hypothetical protein
MISCQTGDEKRQTRNDKRKMISIFKYLKAADNAAFFMY